MTRKITLTFVLCLLLSGLLVGVAYAAEDPPTDHPERPPRLTVGGEVTSVDYTARTFALQNKRGETFTIYVDEATHFRGVIAGFEALEAGMQAGVRAIRQPDGSWLARLVVVPRLRPHLSRFAGRIQAIDLTANSFSIESPQGAITTFQTDEHTRYRGIVTGLEDLETGMPVLVMARPGETGTGLLAVLVAVPRRVPPIRVAGSVANVDLENSAFEIQARDGRTLTFIVDERTRFKGRGVDITGLADLAPGQHVLVAGAPPEGSDGPPLALLVVVDGGERPHFDLVARGQILSLQDGGFTLQARDGRQIPLAVTDETVFRSPGDQVGGLEDLQPGMHAVVAANRQDDGTYQAVVVLVAMQREG